jgi:RNA polymerase sigma-70 factor, ECF subfamily
MCATQTICYRARSLAAGSMAMADAHDIRGGDGLVPLVYERLKSIAESCFRRSGEGQTLQPTALVHEAYLKLALHEQAAWRDEEHFCAVAATAMRQILIDRARRRRRGKHGGAGDRVTLTGISSPESPDVVDVLALHQALEELAALDPRAAQLVELRFFAGLNLPQVARVLDVSLSTAEKEWRRARAWINRALTPPASP